jgi:hypothetical protein
MARAPHCLQPLLKRPWNLKPQHGQVVKRLPQLISNCRFPIADLAGSFARSSLSIGNWQSAIGDD